MGLFPLALHRQHRFLLHGDASARSLLERVNVALAQREPPDPRQQGWPRAAAWLWTSLALSVKEKSHSKSPPPPPFFFFCYGTDNLGGGLVYVSWYPIEMHPNSLLLSVLFLGLWAAFWSKMGDSGLALAPGVGGERLGGGLQVQTCWYVPA